MQSSGVSEAIPVQLREVLAIANGFFAFSGAFLFRPASNSGKPLGIREWNEVELWKKIYPVDLVDVLFFAEDVFGYQFGLNSEKVIQLDPETGELTQIALSVDDLLRKVVANPGELTGDVFLKEWVEAYGSLFAGERLVAKCPFVCGGEFGVSNFIVKDEVLAMRARGKLASSLQGIEDGTKVIFRIE
jgi:hypothetical protein